MGLREQISGCKVIKWLNITDVATLAGKSESAVRRWIKKKTLKAYKMGNEWKVDPDDYQKYLRNMSNIQY